MAGTDQAKYPDFAANRRASAGMGELRHKRGNAISPQLNKIIILVCIMCISYVLDGRVCLLLWLVTYQNWSVLAKFSTITFVIKPLLWE